MTPYRRRAAFALVEVVVVCVIVAVLFQLAIAAVQLARAAAQRSDCANRMRQLGIAFQSYHSEHGRLPCGFSSGSTPWSAMRHTPWHVMILPHLELQAIWQAALVAHRQSPDPHTRPPHYLIQTVVPVFCCPADARLNSPQLARDKVVVALTSYLGVNGVDFAASDGALFQDSRVRYGDVTDGVSFTLLVGERPPSADLWFGWWYTGVGQRGTGSVNSTLGARERNAGGDFGFCPGDYNGLRPGRIDFMCDSLHFWSLHPGGSTFLSCDGSARFLSYRSNDVLPALATRAGGEAAAMP